MEWYIMDGGSLNGLVSQLGAKVGTEDEEIYMCSEECQEVLAEIGVKLDEDDPSNLQVRRQLYTNQIIQKDLVPIITVGDFEEGEGLAIIAEAVKVFAKLTMPLQLLNPQEQCLQSDSPGDKTKDIQLLLLSAKRAFVSEKLVVSILTHMQTVLTKAIDSDDLPREGFELLLCSLVLFRNILYTVEGQLETRIWSRNTILFMLRNSFPDVFIQMTTLLHKKALALSMAQLLFYVYADQYMTHTTSSEKLSHRKSYSMVSILSDSDETAFDEKKNIQELRERLQQFSMVFLNSSFSALVQGLQSELVLSLKQSDDEWLFLWILRKFVKQIAVANISIDSVRSVLSTQVFSFVAYMGTVACEQLLVLRKKQVKKDQAVKMFKLVIAVLLDLLTTVEHFMESKNASQLNTQYLQELIGDLVRMSGLRQLMILLIRHFHVSILPVEYLGKLIVANHTYITLSEQVETDKCFNMLGHISQFATTEVMKRYGELLENFSNNPRSVNECVLTMMHHVVGDCNRPSALLQVSILKTLSDMMHYQYPLSEDYHDLVCYILQLFERMAVEDPYKCAKTVLMIDDESGSDSEQDSCEGSGDASGDGQTWSESDIDMMFMIYSQYEKEPGVDIIEKTLEAFAQQGISKTRIDVITHLKSLGIGLDELGRVLSDGDKNEASGSDQGTMEYREGCPSPDCNDLFTYCFDKIKFAGQTEHLEWIQKELLEACYVKLGGKQTYGILEEPVPYYHSCQDHSIPLIPYTSAQEQALQDNAFMGLLLSIGIHLPEDSGNVFPRIPHFWNVEDLFTKAEKLAPIKVDELKFPPEDIYSRSPCTHTTDLSEDMDVADSQPATDMFRPKGKPAMPGSLWLAFVQKCNLQRNHRDKAGRSKMSDT